MEVFLRSILVSVLNNWGYLVIRVVKCGHEAHRVARRDGYIRNESRRDRTLSSDFWQIAKLQSPSPSQSLRLLSTHDHVFDLSIPIRLHNGRIRHFRYQLHVEEIPLCLRLQSLHLSFLDVLSSAHMGRPCRCRQSVRLEDQVLLGGDRLRLHGGNACEDVEDLVMAG